MDRCSPTIAVSVLLAAGFAAAPALCLAAPTTSAPATPAQTPTPAEEEFDLSEWLLDRKGLLPAPIVITEPAVGYCGGLAFLFFREPIREAAEAKRAGRHAAPPDIYGAAIAATENGTQFVGGGAMVSFKDDRWRHRGIPALRCQDDHVAAIETELRSNVTARWAAVGFAGIGRARGRGTGFDEAGTPDTQGIGFRYLIASRLGMYTGIDYARGPEDHAW